MDIENAPHMPTAEELRELAIKIFFEENPQATTNPEEYELRAPEGKYYLEARRRAMTGITDQLYEALRGYQTEIQNIIETLKGHGENVEGYREPIELENKITSLENQLSSITSKLENSRKTIEKLEHEKKEIENKLQQIPEPKEKEPQPSWTEQLGPLHVEEAETEEEEGEMDTEKEEIEKESKEHPELSEKTIKKIVKDHKTKSVKFSNRKGKGVKLSKVPKIREKRHGGPRLKTQTITQTPIGGVQDATIFKQVNELLVHMYDNALEVLRQSINCGNTNVPQGILSLMLFADLLHGGAYLAPVQNRPYTAADPMTSPYNSGPLRNTKPTEGLFGWLVNMLGVTNATAVPESVIINSNVPHVFPKLLSDEAYAYVLMVLGYATTTDVFKNVGTGVQTYVAAASQGLEALSHAAESGAKVLESGVSSIQKLTGGGNGGGKDTQNQTRSLMPLLDLVTKVAGA